MHSTPLEQARLAGEKLHHFHGGLRLRHNKKVSCQTPLESTPLPPRLFIPLLQHAGEPAEPLVERGQQVLKGERIGRFGKPVAGFVHASTSGTITAIARQPISHPLGLEGLCIVLKPDGRDQWVGLTPMPDWQSADAATLRQKVHESGITGLGGAVFPTGTKVDAANAAGIHTLILNGAECEPYISCDEMLMREQPEKIIEGARVLHRAIGTERVIIAIEDQMGAVSTALQTAIDRLREDYIQLIKVTTIYPEGGEKQLIQVLTGLEVPTGKWPTELGLLCQNVATAAAVADAVIDGKPLVERVVTVTGHGVRTPRNVIAALGTPISSLIEQCGGYTADAARLVIGGPIMGYALASDQNPVVKATNCVLVLNDVDIQPAQAEMPCIRCGECARVCPAHLLPQTLHWQIRHELPDDAADYGLLDCIECGCCDLVCPSHIPLVEWFRFGKSELRQLELDRSRAAMAKDRFEARESRLERLKQERSVRMEAKKQALSDDGEKKARIAAAVQRVQDRSVSDDAPSSETEETGPPDADQR